MFYFLKVLVTHSCPTLSNPMDWLQPTRLLCPWNSPGKNTGMGCHSLLQGDLPNPVLEPVSPALQADSLPSEPLGKPPFPESGSSFYGKYLTDPGSLLHLQDGVPPPHPEGLSRRCCLGMRILWSSSGAAMETHNCSKFSLWFLHGLILHSGTLTAFYVVGGFCQSLQLHYLAYRLILLHPP